MKFPDALLDQIKAHFRLSDYIGKRVELKRQGHEMVGLSPFNNEKTPSFCVNDAKAFWCDFSSGKTGDIIDWVVEAEGLDFVQAVKSLAHEAGIPLPERDARSQAVERRRQQLRDILQAAQDVFVENLRDGRQGAVAREYLERRGLSLDDCARFGIGYALDANIHLKERLIRDLHLDSPDIAAAGLLVTVDGRPPYDRYRDRITFPIRDVAGHLVSFGGRALKAETKAKYLNGPDTELFDKGKNLYGLDMARKVLATGPGPLLVAEGYMDVVACLRAGIAACAPMGTSLTETQLDLMWRYHAEPTLCFDRDAAGQRAAVRAMDMAVPKLGAGRSLRFVTLVDAKDPDEVLRKRGADALRAQLTKAVPLVSAIFERERNLEALDTPERWANFRERLRAIVRKIGDRSLSGEYGQAFRERIEAMRKRPSDAPASAESMAAARSLREAIPPAVRALAYWLVKDPARALDDIEHIADTGFGHEGLDRMANEALAWLMTNDPDGERLAQHLHAVGMGELVVSLGDPRGLLADATEWRRVCWARMEYVRLDAEIRRTKAEINGPEGLRNFMALKAQRDRAKAAL